MHIITNSLTKPNREWCRKNSYKAGIIKTIQRFILKSITEIYTQRTLPSEAVFSAPMIDFQIYVETYFGRQYETGRNLIINKKNTYITVLFHCTYIYTY